MGDFCKIYAMDTERRAALLGLLDLKSADHKVATMLYQTVLAPYADKIVDSFYDYLLQHNQYTILLDRGTIPSLKKTQAGYLRSFGKNFDTSDYFDYRLRVGLAHKKVGLTLGLYQCAYRELQQLMLNEVPDDFLEAGISSQDLCCFIHKITTLDMTLAIETYHDASVTDIQDELKHVHVEKEVLNERVNTDSLTGLSTKDYGITMLERYLSSEEENKALCIIMIDIDFFKVVNDTYGHLAGDAVLRKIAGLLNSAVRDFDVVSRFGGEEFLVVLSRATKEIAMKVAERMRYLVIDNPTSYEGKEIKVTISQGVAVAQSESDTMQFLNKADMALYEAKDQGRDCIVMSGADVTRD